MRGARDGVRAVLTDYKTRHETIPIVTVVLTSELPQFLGSWDRRTIRRHLVRLRLEGVLVAREGRLQANVRLPEGKTRCYVFKGMPADVPRLGRPRRRARVFTV